MPNTQQSCGLTPHERALLFTELSSRGLLPRPGIQLTRMAYGKKCSDPETTRVLQLISPFMSKFSRVALPDEQDENPYASDNDLVEEAECEIAHSDPESDKSMEYYDIDVEPYMHADVIENVHTTIV